MNKHGKKVAAYVGIPLLFTILGYIVLYLGGTPVIHMIKSQANMVITKGAPSYSNEFDPRMSEVKIKTKGTMETGEIQVPGLDTHYGNLTCEKIALTAPLYYGDSDTVLSKGVGQYTASGLPGEGKPILIGGHDSTYFAVLERVKKGDVFVITTNYGEFQYKVTGTKLAKADDAKAYDLSLDREQLILYTCYPFGKVIGNRNDRFFVYCDRIMDSGAVTE